MPKINSTAPATTTNISGGEVANSPRLVSGRALAKRYSVSPRTITAWTQRGILPTVIVNQRLFRYDVRACDKALGKFQV
jgi:hypothetical protein